MDVATLLDIVGVLDAVLVGAIVFIWTHDADLHKARRLQQIDACNTVASMLQAADRTVSEKFAEAASMAVAGNPNPVVDTGESTQREKRLLYSNLKSARRCAHAMRWDEIIPVLYAIEKTAFVIDTSQTMIKQKLSDMNKKDWSDGSGRGAVEESSRSSVKWDAVSHHVRDITEAFEHFMKLRYHTDKWLSDLTRCYSDDMALRFWERWSVAAKKQVQDAEKLNITESLQAAMDGAERCRKSRDRWEVGEFVVQEHR